jgi:outer membrane protein OmpA-like peptidoglycan-associated protein
MTGHSVFCLNSFTLLLIENLNMKGFIAACISFLFVSAQAQLPVLVKDEFSGNPNGWWTGTGENYSMKIENGKYIITTTQKDHGRSITITPYFDKKKDFSLEASFIQRSGSIDNGFGIIWGEGENSRRHGFMITTNGYYQILSSEKIDKANNWVEYKSVKPLGTVNVLKVEQRQSKWYYYINDKQVEVTNALPIYGSGIGLINYTDMVLEADNFIFKHDAKINLPPSLSKGLVKENLGPQVNSEYDDVAPIISADGRTIMFGIEYSPENVGGKEDGEDIWMTTSADGKTWSKRVNMNTVNDETINNLAAVSADNNMLLFCKTNGFQVRRRTNEGWSQPEFLNVKFNNEAPHMEGNLSSDGKAILFTVKLPQDVYYNPTSENRDIYVTLQGQDGKWSDPINLGRQINTEGDEVSPFLAADGRTLYFASNGRPGYGGTDIFMSKRLDNSWTKWSEPVNLGPEINSIGFDAYYTIPASADYAYMVSNTNSYGKSDLVRVKLPEVIKPEPVVLLLGKTLNAKTKAPVSADILFEDLATRKEEGEAISDPKTGTFRITLSKGKNYGIRAAATGFISVNENLELMSINQYTEIQKDLLLVPIEVGETIQLNNVFFEQGRPVLKSQSFPELDRLFLIMQENPTVQIELAGHTDNVGNKEALMKLSQDRVAAVKAYLEKRGIKKERIVGKGYGPTKPIAPNSTEADRQKNRRVEVKITKK